MAAFQQARRQWVEEALTHAMAVRDERWSQAIAAGSLAFVEKVKTELGLRAMHRAATKVDGVFTLREEGEAYTSVFADKNNALRLDNSHSYEQKAEIERA